MTIYLESRINNAFITWLKHSLHVKKVKFAKRSTYIDRSIYIMEKKALNQ